jgi:hypothetical protein
LAERVVDSVVYKIYLDFEDDIAWYFWSKNLYTFIGIINSLSAFYVKKG